MPTARGAVRALRALGAALALAIAGTACSGAPSSPSGERASDATTSTLGVSAAAGTTSPTAAAPTPTSTTAAAPPSTTAAPRPIDPAGAGDAYFPLLGNGGFDVVRYDIEITADPPATTDIGVRTTITATATATLDAFHLDLAGMSLASVTVDGAPATFTRDGAELVVVPARPIASGATFVSVVEYAGTPERIVDAEQTVVGWQRVGNTTFVVSEPNGAHNWLASSDHPSDKAAFTFRIDVPSAVTAAANGHLVSSVAMNGRTTFVWDAPEPMATYLATVAIGPFTIVDDGPHGAVHIRHVLPTSLVAQLTPKLARTGEMLDVLTSMFGPYPFADYGTLVIDARLGYALETQTLSLFDRPIALSDTSDVFQVHELAHQWFGDSVSVRAWRDIWLNEGFATYAESLWRERTEPSFDIDAAMRTLARRTMAPVLDPGPGALFARNIYDRGALALHALRRDVGDQTFFAILRAWATDHARANGSTEELVALAGRLAGRDVAPLLDAWLAADPMPALPR
jgi:aminopeptidase N